MPSPASRSSTWIPDSTISEAVQPKGRLIGYRRRRELTRSTLRSQACRQKTATAHKRRQIIPALCRKRKSSRLHLLHAGYARLQSRGKCNLTRASAGWAARNAGAAAAAATAFRAGLCWARHTVVRHAAGRATAVRDVQWVNLKAPFAGAFPMHTRETTFAEPHSGRLVSSAIQDAWRKFNRTRRCLT